MEKQILTRQELYEMVWSEPMRTIAKRIIFLMLDKARFASAKTYQFLKRVIGPGCDLGIKSGKGNYQNITVMIRLSCQCLL